jgi:hypothetical protein
MTVFSRAVLTAMILLTALTACQTASPPAIQTLPPPGPTATPFPAPSGSFSGTELQERSALLHQIHPQAGKVASNRVEALIQIHDFVEFYDLSLEDGNIDFEELTEIVQHAANARASLYKPGQPDMIQIANSAGWLVDLAIYGDWETGGEHLTTFRRTLPRKPSLD